MFMNGKGEPVGLLQQTQDHFVVYGPYGGKGTQKIPAHEFFGSHREATRDEVEKFSEAAPSRDPVALANAAADRAEAAQKATEKVGAAVTDTAKAVTKTSGEVDKAAGNAQKAADRAEAAAAKKT